MKIDETFESVNRIWQETSVIVVIHAVAFGLAVYAHLIPMRLVSEGMKSVGSLPEMAALRASLKSVGLDLPLVVGAGLIVYVVLFQRLGALAVRVPMFQLRYSQPALWRAGKCFDELRQLAYWFEGYTASSDLADMEVTLSLAVTQFAKEFKEHHRELVDEKLAGAAMWARYYSGFCLLAFASAFFVMVSASPTKRSLLLPLGLLTAALAARCGWEFQIEQAVLGRLRFALDCAIVSGREREATKPKEEAAVQRNWEDSQSLARDADRFSIELKLAAALVMLPPPCLPYEHFWALHYARSLWPWPSKDAGLPMVRNESFRAWFVRAVHDARRRPENNRIDGGANGADHEYPDFWEVLARYRAWLHEFDPEKAHEMVDRRHKLWDNLWFQTTWPNAVPDDRFVVRLLRTRSWGRVGRWLFPRILLVDKAERYWNRPNIEREKDFARVESLRQWTARTRDS
jgi:hypothetical protein